MAVGDAAAAAGMDTVAGTDDLRNGYIEHNQTRDYLAAHQTSGTHSASQISSGTFALARIPTMDLAHVPQAAAVIGTGRAIYDDGSQMLVSGVGLRVAGNLDVGARIYNEYARNNGVSGGLAIYVTADGQIGVSSSSRRFKKAIKGFAPDKQAVLAMELVQFHWKGTGELDHGLIAEQLSDLGLEWLIWRDDEGIPAGVRYERIGLALLPVVQDHEARIAALEKGK